jgi:hypothetical protein
MNIPKEAILYIPVDSFMVAATANLNRVQDISRISSKERKLLMKRMRGYAVMAEDTRDYEASRKNKRIANDTYLGIGRLGLALNAWYDFQESAGSTDKRIKTARAWVAGLGQKTMRGIMRSYLNQEDDEFSCDGIDEITYETAEVEATTDTCHAFIAFQSYLESNLAEKGMEENRTYDVGRGVLLGAIALREAVELHEFNQKLKIATS